MKADDLEQRFKNALIYGTSHPEAYMTKADELWEKCAEPLGFDNDSVHAVIKKSDFLAALKEYGEHVRSEAVKVCREVATERMPAPTQGFCITNDGLGCAAAIEKMPLP